jgi:hypothetical protein
MKLDFADSLQPKIDAAFRAASRKAIADARRKGTGVITWRDGRVVEISCDEAERLLEQAEADASRPQSSNV